MEPRFFVDVGSPYAWLAAERVAGGALGEDVVWEPVLLGAIFAAPGFGSWSLTDAREDGMREVERRAATYGLPPVRWPDPWPGNYPIALGVRGVPTVVVGGRAFWGDDRLEDAAAARR